MVNLNSDMFSESKKSHASGNLIVQIVSFLILFFVIYILESLIPAFLSFKPLVDELTAAGYIDNGTTPSFTEAMELSTNIAMSPRVMIPTLICTVFGTLLSIFYCRFIEMRSLSSMGMRKKHLVSHYLIGLGIGIIMMTLITMLTVLTGANTIKLCTSIDVGLIFLYLLGFFFQGMSEEFIFRGCLMNSIGGKHSPLLAVIISAAGFAAAHLANPGLTVLAFLNLMLFGVFASVYMIRTGDIWGVCGIHSIWNFTQGNLYGISVSGSGETESVFRTAANSSHAFLTGGAFGIEGSIFTTIILAAGIAIVLKLTDKKA